MKTDYFTFSELIQTDTGLTNIPNDMQHVRNLCELTSLLNKIRLLYDAPIKINSAYRSTAVNEAVNGVPNSLHTKGCAADIRPLYEVAHEFDENLQHLINVVKSFEKELKEFIIYPTFIHIAI